MQNKPTYEQLEQRVKELEGLVSRHQLTEAEIRYRILFNCDIYEVHLWKLVYDEKGNIKTWSLIDANNAALKAWDKSLPEIVGKTTDEIFPGVNATEMFMPIVKKIFDEGAPHKWDEYFPKTQQHLYMMSIPFGEYFFSIGINITSQMDQEKLEHDRLKEMEVLHHQTRLVLESSGVAIWKYNIQDNSLEWDDSMYELYEINREDFSGDYAAWELSLHPDDKENAERELELAIAGEKEFDTVFRIVTPVKKIKYIHAKATILKDSEARPHIMLGTNWDVSDEKNYENLLIEAKSKAESFAEAKSSFMANMSHEIRTPMNGIIGLTSLLSQTELNDEQLELLNSIQSCGKNLMNVINDILDYTAIETGNVKINDHHFDLYQKIDDLVTLFSAAKYEHKVQIVVEIEKEVPQFIYSDEFRISQILSNFLSNAIKFNKSNFTVEFKMKVNRKLDDGIELEFRVIDHGIGMSEEEQKHIFDEFKQADSSIIRNYGGTGLGLAICSKISKLMGGQIKVQSEKGKGSTFTFLLKVKEGTKVEKQSCKSRSEDLSKSYPHQILIVEDNKVNQKVALKLLAECGYTCDVANNGLEAVSMCKEKTYSLIFMDLQMPKMDGLTASKLILEKQPDMSIVAMTANVLEKDREKCTAAGMKAFIGKPFVLKDIADVIRKI